ncbi:MAG: hypothetical protein ACQCN4_11325 [Candidatus Bathyarchaeia archaeon]|jgi:hypothetical protein
MEKDHAFLCQKQPQKRIKQAITALLATAGLAVTRIKEPLDWLSGSLSQNTRHLQV